MPWLGPSLSLLILVLLMPLVGVLCLRVVRVGVLSRMVLPVGVLSCGMVLLCAVLCPLRVCGLVC
jgi:hypothetical protein